MSALAPIIRIIVAVFGIALIHAAFLTDQPALGFYAIAGAGAVGLADGWRRRAISTAGYVILLVLSAGFFLVALYGGGTTQMHLLITVPILAHLALCGLFGSTLLPGRTALITCFSRIERAPIIDPVIERYTRILTWLWVCYFAAITMAAAVLAVIGDFSTASWVTSVVSPAAGVVLFAGDHLYRYLRPSVFGPTSIVRTFRSMADPAAWRLMKNGS